MVVRGFEGWEWGVYSERRKVEGEAGERRCGGEDEKGGRGWAPWDLFEGWDRQDGLGAPREVENGRGVGDGGGIVSVDDGLWAYGVGLGIWDMMFGCEEEGWTSPWPVRLCSLSTGVGSAYTKGLAPHAWAM